MAIRKVWDLGELLVPLGEFLENNHPLAPSPYVSEWHEGVLKKHLISAPANFLEAVEQSKVYGVPIAPKYVATGWQDLTAEEGYELMSNITISPCGEKIQVPEKFRQLVYRAQIDIDAEGYLGGDESLLVLNLLAKVQKSLKINLSIYESAVEWLNSLADYEIRPRTTLRIGARMGKPEGSKHREMNPPVHGLWPVGFNSGSQRRIRDAARKNESVSVGVRVCPVCDTQTWRGVCSGDASAPHEATETNFVGVIKQNLGTEEIWKDCLETTHQATEPEVKGSKGLRSAEKTPEAMLKGVLRHRNGTSAFRDGTIRFDMVDITMTHFRPDEIGLTATQAVELGYVVDCQGNPVVSDDQIIELMPQDVVVAENCVKSLVATHEIYE